MAERKEKANRKQTFTFLHELSRHIIDRCDVISIHGMPKTKSVSQKAIRATIPPGIETMKRLSKKVSAK